MKKKKAIQVSGGRLGPGDTAALDATMGVGVYHAVDLRMCKFAPWTEEALGSLRTATEHLPHARRQVEGQAGRQPLSPRPSQPGWATEGSRL